MQLQQETGTEHVGVYVSQHMVVAKTEALEPQQFDTDYVLRGSATRTVKKEFIDNVNSLNKSIVARNVRKEVL